MKKTSHRKGFTLIELLVVITITLTLFIAGSKINFNKMSDKQAITLLNNTIVSQFEEIRNDALLGKGVNSDILVPEAWEIKYSSSGSGEITVEYSTGSLNKEYPELNFTPPNFHSITNINCLDINGDTVDYDIIEATINIQGNKISISSDCDDSARKLQFTSQRKGLSDIIEINTLNGIIQIK